jgi:hypothetical protein
MSVGIWALLYNIKRNRRIDAPAELTNDPGLIETHVAFQQAAVSVLHRLSYLSVTGLPPSWSGILWTWPASYRATRDFPAAVESLQLTFSAAAMTGPAELLDPSAAVFEAIGRSCASFPTRRAGREVFSSSLEKAYEELGTYTAALRERLSPQAGAAQA